MQPISIPQIQYYLTNLQQLTLKKGKIQQEKCALFSQNIRHLSQGKDMLGLDIALYLSGIDVIFFLATQ